MDIENIMLSEVNQTKTNTVCSSLYVKSKTNSKKQGKESWLPGAEGLEKGEMLVKWYKLPTIRRISSLDPKYSMVTIIYNTVLYT